MTKIYSYIMYAEEETIEAVVSSERKVTYNDIEYSLTRLTRELLNINHDVQPTRYWSWSGKSLYEYYNDTYKAEG